MSKPKWKEEKRKTGGDRDSIILRLDLYGGVKVTLVWGHIYYPDMWVTSFHPAYSDKPLSDINGCGPEQEEEAKKRAVAEAKGWLKAAMDTLSEV